MFAGMAFELCVVVCALVRRSFRRYIGLNLYMAVACGCDLAGYRILALHGVKSAEYSLFYYYASFMLTIALYIALINLYSVVFDEMHADKLVRFGAVLLLLGTCAVSFAVAWQSTESMVMRFIIEVSQNLYFVGVVLTYVLWGAIVKLRETRTRLVQFVLSLGIYFSALAANYALRNLWPSMSMIWIYLPPVLGCLLPLSWAYAFLRLSEESKLAPARLGVTVR
jgi:glucan phosphoethanolaminetransferase (alkaline phosphatase superfamily)